MSNEAMFNCFSENLKLDPIEYKKARKRHNEVRDLLKANGLFSDSYLQGSFGRKTMRPPLKDIDIVGITSKAKLDSLGVDRLFEDAKSILRKAYLGVKFDSGRSWSDKAMEISFPDVDFTLDLLLCYEENGVVRYAIRRSKNFEVTRSRRMGKLISDRNGATGGKFIHWVRMLKTLKEGHPELDKLNGIVLESVAYKVLTRDMTHELAMRKFLVEASSHITYDLRDPAKESTLLDSIRSEEIDAAKAKLDLLAKEDDWSKIFVTKFFPSQSSSTSEDTKSLREWGSATSSTRTTNPSRPWSSLVTYPDSTHSRATSLKTQSAYDWVKTQRLTLTSDWAVQRQIDFSGGLEWQVTFYPPKSPGFETYDSESARIVFPRKGSVPLVWPMGEKRSWRHRNPLDFPKRAWTENTQAGSLCLWYPEDKEPLRWTQGQGLKDFLERVARHLFSEENARRVGAWPGEETPHGNPPGGTRWPLKTSALKKAVKS